MNERNRKTLALATAIWLGAVAAACAQEPDSSRASRGNSGDAQAAEKVTLKRAVALALQNSRELLLARLQYTVAEKTAAVSRSAFRPNLFTGSGAAYTNGFPQTLSGAAPSVFNLSFVQTLFNRPLRGELLAAEERADARRLGVEQARDAVILRTATAYLELAKVRHSLELLRKERQSAQRILDVTRQRTKEGLELPIEVTRAQLSAARIEQRIVQLEGREEFLEGQLRAAMGLPSDLPIAIAEEGLPPAPEQPLGALVELAVNNSADLQQAERERRAREHIWKGERGGYWPTVDLIGYYGVLSRINNFDEFFRTFRRNSLTVGIDVKIPIFNARTSATVALARADLSRAEVELRNKRAELEIGVRRQARRARELDAAREVARLELELAQENLRILQVRFEEGRLSLRELETVRLEESDKWMQFLDADFERQRAQLELLRTTGQLAQVFQ